MSRVLVVEDEERVASFVARGLRASGYAPAVVADGLDAVARLAAEEFDLVLLDIGLPGVDGLEVLRRVRGSGNRVPVIVLTARDSVPDTVAALDGGADDFLPKPFSFDELLARIRVRLREDRAAVGTTMSSGDLSLDMRTREATVADRTVRLSAREYALLEVFLRHPGQVLSREQLLSSVWGYDFDPGSNVVDVYVRTLRRKLGAERITTVRGMGYRLDDAGGSPRRG